MKPGSAETADPPAILSPPSVSQRVLSHFARITSSGKFISEIDGLRFIAIGTVVLFHLVVNLSVKFPYQYVVPAEGNLLVAIARHGFRGVELFFIISGFILAVPFASHYLMAKPPVSLRSYFFRRLTRLEPPYVLCMTLLFAARVLLKNEDAGELFPHLAASFVYLHNIIYQAESPINNVAWSLEIEIQFYVLVPLLARVFSIQRTALRRGTIVGAAVGSVILSWLLIGPESFLFLTIARFLHFFLIGFLLADVFLCTWKESPQRTWSWDLVSLIGWPLLFVLWNFPEWSSQIVPWGTRPAIAEFLFPTLAFFLYVAVFRGHITHAILTNPWIATIGGMCYTMYLFHNQIIGTLAGITGQLAPFPSYTLNVCLQALLVLPPMVLLVACYFALVEKPCMRKDWPQRLAARGMLFVRRVKAEIAAQIQRG